MSLTALTEWCASPFKKRCQESQSKKKKAKESLRVLRAKERKQRVNKSQFCGDVKVTCVRVLAYVSCVNINACRLSFERNEEVA